MKLSAKLFIETGDNYSFGPGRADLLRAVDELGSLRKAAQKFGMSYRWAWGRINDVENALGITLLVQDSSGRAKILSAEAKALLSWFGAMEKDLAAVMSKGEANCPEFLRNR